MALTIILFLAGFYILLKGAKFLVEGGMSVARRLQIPGFITGLVIVGIGTSIPEFAISLLANIRGEASIGVGTIIGENTFNLLFILGLSALLFPLQFRPHWVKRDLVWNIAAVLLVLSLAAPWGGGGGVLTQAEGLVLFFIFLSWLWYSVRLANGADLKSESKNGGARSLALPLTFLMILGGILGVFIGGKWVVEGAVELSRALGLSEALIGLAVIGIGTAIPELAVTIVAAYRGNSGIAVGNIVGSNIFDLLMVLGTGAIVRPIFFEPKLLFAAGVTLFAAVLLYGLLLTGPRYLLTRRQGLTLISIYVIYLIYILGSG